jgi:hypothetical protein
VSLCVDMSSEEEEIIAPKPNVHVRRCRCKDDARAHVHTHVVQSCSVQPVESLAFLANAIHWLESCLVCTVRLEQFEKLHCCPSTCVRLKSRPAHDELLLQIF